MEYEFTLKFKIPTDPVDELIEKLAEAGCDDALIGIGTPGKIALEFIRESTSAKQAIISAIRDVKSAIPDAVLIEVGPDFVGITDVADLIGVSRQNIRKLIVNHAASFPTAVHEGTSAIWHLRHVLEWFKAKGLYEKSVYSLFEISRVAMEVNITKEVKRLPLSKDAELEQLVS